MAALTLSCLNIKIIVIVNIFYMAGVSSRFLFLLAFFFCFGLYLSWYSLSVDVWRLRLRVGV